MKSHAFAAFATRDMTMFEKNLLFLIVDIERVRSASIACKTKTVPFAKGLSTQLSEFLIDLL